MYDLIANSGGWMRRAQGVGGIGGGLGGRKVVDLKRQQERGRPFRTHDPLTV